MLGCNAKHRGARAYAGIERHDLAIGHFFGKPVEQVNLGAPRPLRVRRRLRDSFDDAFGGADLVGGLRYFKAALRMDDYANAWVLAANALDMLRLEALMDRAVALPQDDARFANRFRRIAFKILVRIPHDHFVERDTHPKGSVAAKVLVGQKQDFLPAVEGPAHYRSRV